jgi:hypothetical protein
MHTVFHYNKIAAYPVNADCRFSRRNLCAWGGGNSLIYNELYDFIYLCVLLNSISTRYSYQPQLLYNRVRLFLCFVLSQVSGKPASIPEHSMLLSDASESHAEYSILVAETSATLLEPSTRVAGTSESLAETSKWVAGKISTSNHIQIFIHL